MDGVCDRSAELAVAKRVHDDVSVGESGAWLSVECGARVTVRRRAADRHLEAGVGERGEVADLECRIVRFDEYPDRTRAPSGVPLLHDGIAPP